MRAAFSIALHMHQPIIPAGPAGAPISNLRWMMEHQSEGDNHNAPVFKWCYERMGEFIPALKAEGKKPRAMLDYSGSLLWGLEEMGLVDTLGKLRALAQNFPAEAEFLGTPWGHAVAPSTPPADYRLHIRAWKKHFEHLFGAEALSRVHGFSPSEMALPNHPDVAFEFVRSLREEGFDWVLVQEHTVETPEGTSLRERYLPHRLVCRNLKGEVAEITALIKTQGSDTKLVAQMQPYFEAKSLEGSSPQTPAWGRMAPNPIIPKLVAQIADGENGGVMMNEFPPKFYEVIRELGDGHGEVQALNASEYLALIASMGLAPQDFPVCQPIHQTAFFKNFHGDFAAAVETCKRADGRFHMEGGSWTNDRTWVGGYAGLLGDMEAASVRFHKKYGTHLPDDPTTNADLFNLLCAQTSCFRYWGAGLWPDYGREFCRRVQ